MFADEAYSGVRMSLKAELEKGFVRYVNPALDGTHESVTGKGQVALAGPAGEGAEAYKIM